MIYGASISNSHPLWLFTGIQDIIDNCCRWYHQAIASQVRYISKERRRTVSAVACHILSDVSPSSSWIKSPSPGQNLCLSVWENCQKFFSIRQMFDRRNLWLSPPTSTQPTVWGWQTETVSLSYGVDCLLSSWWILSTNRCSTYFCARRWFRRKYWVFV